MRIRDTAQEIPREIFSSLCSEFPWANISCGATAWLPVHLRSSRKRRIRFALPGRTFLPDKSAQGIYDQLYPLFRELYFTWGERGNNGLGEILPTLIAIAESAA